MKKLLSILLLFVCQLAQSQTVPQGINYQAVALDQRGQPIPGIDIVGRPIDDAEIGVRVSILENTPTGNILYQEEHEVLTDLYGMFNLVIGQGLQVSVDPFSSINWQGDKFLQVELSIENDGEFVLSAVQQLMSVPYAFLAENAMVAQTAIDVDDADADPTNELQSLSISGDSLTLSNGNTVGLPVINDADADPTNEIQVLSRSNDTLYLSNGGYAVLPVDQVNDADADPSNELQTITRSGTNITLSGNGGSVSVFDGNYNNLSNTPTIPTNTSDLTNDSGFLTTEVDGSTTNELQTISKAGGAITLSDNGGSITVFDGDYNDLSNTPTIPTNTSDLTNDSGFLTTEVDGSTTNELQTITKAGGAITLSDNGGSITVFDGDYNDLSNTPTIPTNTSDLTNDSGFLTTEVDGSITNELQILTISNDTIFLSGGGFIKLPAAQGFDGAYSSLTGAPSLPTKTSDLTNDSGFITAEVDGSITNELQVLSISNDTLFLSDGGFAVLPADQVNDADADPSNEIQTLTKLGSTISLTNGGNITVFDGNYNNLSNAPTIPSKTSDLTNDNGFIMTEIDGSNTNELQSLSIKNDSVYLTNGGSIKLPLNNDNNSSNELQSLFVSNDSLFLSKSDQGVPLNALTTPSTANSSSQNYSTTRNFSVASTTSPSAISYVEALRYCANLLEDGHSDWKLATMDEIMSYVENAAAFPSTGIDTWVKVNNPYMERYSGYSPLFGLKFTLNSTSSQFYGQPISAHAGISSNPIATHTCNCFREDANSNAGNNANAVFQVTGDTTFAIPVGETWEIMSISIDVANPPTYTWNATCYNSGSYRCYPASSLLNFISLGSSFRFDYMFPVKCVYGSCGSSPAPTRTETVTQSMMPSFYNYPVLLNSGDQVSLNYDGFIINARLK